jgi:hypothetical protein
VLRVTYGDIANKLDIPNLKAVNLKNKCALIQLLDPAMYLKVVNEWECKQMMKLKKKFLILINSLNNHLRSEMQKNQICTWQISSLLVKILTMAHQAKNIMATRETKDQDTE